MQIQHDHTVPLKIGVVGTGWIAGSMGFFFKWNKRMRMTAACDVNPAILQKFAQQFKIRETYSDFDAMLAKANVDVLYLALPHYLHASFLIKGIEAGKHILCEKPLTTSIEDARQVIARAKKANVKVGVNYQYRYSPRLYSLVKAIQAGCLGKVYYGLVRCPWYRSKHYYDQGPWRLKWVSAGGGTMLIHASHSIDIMAWALGNPISVTGEIETEREDVPGLEVEDTAIGAVRFASGALGLIFGSMCTRKKEIQKRPVSVNYLEFAGSRGQIHYHGPFPASVKYIGIKRHRDHPPGCGLINYSRLVDNFAQWVLTDTPFLNPAEESLKVLSIVFGLYNAARTGQRVSIQL